MALLLLLRAHFPERRGRWLVVHFDHRLRGAESTADARFVRALARVLGERCEVGRWDRAGGQSAVGAAIASSLSNAALRRDGGIAAPAMHASEAGARDARWRFFDERMRAAGATTIALGHQLDDVAETMLMRLARGSGAGGLAAPRPVQRMADHTVRVRPLLDIAADELRTALRAAGASWREDTTNRGGVFFRNRVRQRVLPPLLAVSPADALEGFASSRAQLEEDDDALNAVTRERAGVPRPGRPFSVSALRGQPAALARRAVHAWLLAEGLNATLARSAVAGLIAAVVAGTDLRTSAGTRGWIVLHAGRLLIDPPVAIGGDAGCGWPESVLAMGCTLEGPDGARLRARSVRLTSRRYHDIVGGRFPPASVVHLAVASEALAVGFTVRAWRSGDAYRPLGAPGRAKLQDLFINRKIPRDRRARLPVVSTASGAIVWVPGLPPANESAVKSGLKLVVQLTYFPPGNILRPPLSKKQAHVRSR